MTVRLNRALGRVGLGMLGLDVHTKGIRTLSSRLQEHGCEVAFIGEHLTVDYLVSQAKERDVDLIGLSFSSGAYVEHCRDVVNEMRAQALDIPLMVGGLIHQDDRQALNEIGIEGIFGPGSNIDDIVAFIAKVTLDRVSRRGSAEDSEPEEQVDG